MAMMSIHYGRLTEDDPLGSHEVELEKVWKEHANLKNTGMRYEVQVELVPEILELFETFYNVDRQLIAVNEIEILKQDYEDTLLEECRHPEKAGFLNTKRDALEILLRHFDPDVPIPAKAMPWEVAAQTESHDSIDSFGYDRNEASDDVYTAIRQRQLKNMVRSFLIKQALGYSILALKSNIPKAGRGIFVDGTAPPGSIVAFFPGQVWPREYLIDPPPDLIEFLSWERNPNFQLHFRGDDFLLDCRASPYTVLQNPWAVGHIANHAPISESNARSMSISFFEKMNLNPSLSLYVPNEYAKPPTLMGGSLLDVDPIEMHGMCLLNKRKALTNQEVLFDYRLMWFPDEIPDWYEHVDYILTGQVEQEEDPFATLSTEEATRDIQ